MYVKRKGRWEKIWAALLLLCLFASACQPGLMPSAAPTPQVIALQMTTSLRSLLPALKTCIDERPASALVIEEVTTAAVAPAGEAIGLRWGSDTQPPGIAVVIGQETLAVIVHPNNPIDQLSPADLQAIYAGTRKTWPAGEPGAAVEPWAYPAGEDIQAIITTILLLGVQPSRSATSIAPDPEAMLEAISTSPAAVGFIPRRWLSGDVKEIVINGVEPANLRQPILAITQSEPQGQQKEWLLCVQERLGE